MNELCAQVVDDRGEMFGLNAGIKSTIVSALFWNMCWEGTTTYIKMPSSDKDSSVSLDLYSGEIKGIYLLVSSFHITLA